VRTVEFATKAPLRRRDARHHALRKRQNWHGSRFFIHAEGVNEWALPPGDVEEGAMLLALVFSVQATTAATSAAAAPNPCMDQMSELCKISALFCPTAYPSDLTPGSRGVPCWPEANAPSGGGRSTRVVSRPAGAATPSARAESAKPASVPMNGSGSAETSTGAEPSTRGQHLFGKLFARLFEGR
jgi:hypothetical protein